MVTLTRLGSCERAALEKLPSPYTSYWWPCRETAPWGIYTSTLLSSVQPDLPIVWNLLEDRGNGRAYWCSPARSAFQGREGEWIWKGQWKVHDLTGLWWELRPIKYSKLGVAIYRKINSSLWREIPTFLQHSQCKDCLQGIYNCGKY